MIGAVASGAIKTVKAVVPPGTTGAVLNGYFGVKDYKMAREQGNSKLMSLGKAVGTFAMGEMMGMAFLPMTLAPVAVQMLNVSAQHKMDAINKKGYEQRGKLGSGYFDMNQAGYTMRQRSLNAIQSNGLNLNSALGNEARTYYRSSI